MTRVHPERTQVLRTTAFLMLVTIASKFLGLFRELILLGAVGIGAELDLFVILFGITTIITGALGICIVTSVTPLARDFHGAAGAVALMKEGLSVSLAVWAAATLACVAYVLLTGDGLAGTGMLLALIVPGVVPFAILAEYQVGLFLARGQRTPVIGGNIIISLPLALALLVFDLGIVTYSAGLVASFALRAVIFAWLLTRNAGDPGARDTSRPAVSLFRSRLGKTIAGGSAMLAVSIIYVSATVVARQLGEGEATLIGYGLKIPLFFLTSAWFVLGTAYFANLVQTGGQQPGRDIARLSAINFGLLILAAGFVLVLRMIVGSPPDSLPANSGDILEVFRVSLPFLPLIVFVPLVEMVQRLAATQERHFVVLIIAAAIIAGGLVSQVGSAFSGSRALLFLSPAIATGCGALMALAVLMRWRRLGGIAVLPSDELSQGTRNS